jgi:hypothetical protein
VLREEDGTHWTAQDEGAGVVARKIMADAGHPNWYDERPSIAGGSGGVLEVGASDMAPTPRRSQRPGEAVALFDVALSLR